MRQFAQRHHTPAYCPLKIPILNGRFAFYEPSTRVVALHRPSPGTGVLRSLRTRRGYVVVGVHPERAPLALGGGHPRSPFVGREPELTLLDGALEQVKAGQGQVVGLVGAPGMGKSRLIEQVAGVPSWW